MNVAVTGAAGDFAKAILPRLFEDDDIKSVLAIDIREPNLQHEKLTFKQEDVRSSALQEMFNGCDAVCHLAFILEEIRDKNLIHEVNIDGSKNVIDCAEAAGVKKLVIASSISVYGSHLGQPEFVTEEEFPQGNFNKYYFYDKAEIEHYIEWRERHNPKSKMTITRLRPTAIFGPTMNNLLTKAFVSRMSAFPSPAQPFQFVHDSDLAEAFCLALQRCPGGPINLGTDDYLSVEQAAAIHGQKLIRGPLKVFEKVADIAYRLRLSPVSSQWAMNGDPIVSKDRAKKELGWTPKFSSVESAYIHLIQNGRPILGPDVPGGGVAEVFSRKEVAEAAFEPVTEQHKKWIKEVPALKRVFKDENEIDRLSDRVEHAFIPYKGKSVHLELHRADNKDAPTVVFSPGIGAYARFYLPLLGKLCDEGMNVVGIDRPGHGLSEGPRGDVSFTGILDVVEESIRFARAEFSGPVVLAGSSLGGIITWLALTRNPDVDAAICHNVAHPEIFHEPAMKVKVPLLRGLAKIAPHVPIPIKQVADFDEVTNEPAIQEVMEQESDKIWSWTVPARTVAGLFEYVPPIDWAQVEIPTLVLVGAEDKMVTPEFTRAVLERSSPPDTEMKLLEGMGHLIFHDNLDRSLPEFVKFVKAKTGTKTTA